MPSDVCRILKKLDGKQESFLEISITPDGTLQIYEAYSEDGAQRLADRLKKLGMNVEIVHHSSPCG